MGYVCSLDGTYTIHYHTLILFLWVQLPQPPSPTFFEAFLAFCVFFWFWGSARRVGHDIQVVNGGIGALRSEVLKKKPSSNKKNTAPNTNQSCRIHGIDIFTYICRLKSNIIKQIYHTWILCHPHFTSHDPPHQFHLKFPGISWWVSRHRSMRQVATEPKALVPMNLCLSDFGVLHIWLFKAIWLFNYGCTFGCLIMVVDLVV